MLDTRDPGDFAAGHLRGAVNVGLHGRFAEYAGDVLRPDRDIVLCCNTGRELEAKVRLGRIGFDRVTGALALMWKRRVCGITEDRLTSGLDEDPRGRL